MKVRIINKEDGTESIEELRATDYLRLARHLSVTPAQIADYFKKGMGVQTNFRYYEPV